MATVPCWAAEVPGGGVAAAYPSNVVWLRSEVGIEAGAAVCGARGVAVPTLEGGTNEPPPWQSGQLSKICREIFLDLGFNTLDIAGFASRGIEPVFSYTSIDIARHTEDLS